MPNSDAAFGVDGAGILTVDLSAIAENYRRLERELGPVPCAAVVKANAYGLGADRVAPALHSAGCRQFFVAQLGEGIALRDLLAEDAEIFVLNGVLPGQVARFLRHRLIPVLNDLAQIEEWRNAGRGAPAAIHLDTGMNRLGLDPKETARLVDEPDLLSGLKIRLWLSHLVSAEEAGNPLNEEQRRSFAAVLARLPAAPASLANSSGIFLGPAFHFDLGRPGVALYGVNPTPGRPNPMRPVVELAVPILQVRVVDSPMTVGYGATHRVAKKGKIATVSIGYADGYGRALSARGRCRIAGKEVPIVGRVSMDLITVDVTTLPENAVRPGDPAIILDRHHDVDSLASEAGTIGYEILTALGARYRRRYIDMDA